MCHEYRTSDWVWEPDDGEPTEDNEDELPTFRNEETETASELVTDGGDET